MGEVLAHRNHPSPYPLNEHLGNLWEVHPPRGMAEEVVEAQATLMGADQVIIAQGVKALQATTPVGVAQAGEIPAAATLEAEALGATMNRLTKTQTKVLGHLGMEVTLRAHNKRLYQAGTTGNSSTPPGGELSLRDHNRGPRGRTFGYAPQHVSRTYPRGYQGRGLRHPATFASVIRDVCVPKDHSHGNPSPGLQWGR